MNEGVGVFTTKLLEEVAVPPPVVTEIGPVVAPLGTAATICVVELRVKLALVPLKRTAEGVIKLVPFIVMLSPTKPLVGVKLLIVGTVFDEPVMVKPDEILKKMLPTASTLTRALPVGVPGIVTVSDPSFGVFSARTIGKLTPLVERVILTFAQLTRPPLVPATFQLTV